MTDPARTLEQRVGALEDLRAIELLKHRYLRACDRQQPDVVRDCFTPDAIIDYEGFPVLDREAFVDTYQTLGCLSHIVDMHHGQNPVIELTGPDSARGWFDLFFYQLEEGETPRLHLSAVAYEDDYVRRDGRWWILRSIARSLLMVRQSIGEDGVPRVEAHARPQVLGLMEARPIER